MSPVPSARSGIGTRVSALAEAGSNAERPPHILTVVLEDYYHNFKRVIQRSHWSRFETRVEKSTLRTLDLLDEFGIRATFFSVGWIASTMPEVIREVAARGHEIASKGYHQRSLSEMSPIEFRDDLARSREALERASGERVLGYRAPGWLGAGDLWALEVLAQEGYVYDSSIKPIFVSLNSELSTRFAHQKQFGDRVLWEFPISTIELAGALLPIGAGNYFRQLPEAMIGRAVAHWSRRYGDAPFTMYFHTWELDPDQPQITAAPLLNRIRKYRNLEKVPEILRRYFGQYPFAGIRDHLRLRPTLPDSVAECHDALERPISTYGLGASSPTTTRDGSGSPAIELGETDERIPVTLVVPCYNEEHSLPYLANTLRSVEQALARRYRLEYVFVDDRSVDSTWSVLQHQFGLNPRSRFIRHGRNRGVAAGIATGIKAARTEIVCSIDCDCTYDPHELVSMLPLLGDGVDLVTASPYHPEGRVRNVPLWRLSLSRSLSRIYRLVLHQQLHTFTSCFRVYRRSAVVDLKIQRQGFLGIAELIGKLALSGARIIEHPATLEVRVLGHSKMRVLRTIVGHLVLIGTLTRRRWRSERDESRDSEPSALPPDRDTRSTPSSPV